MGQGDDDYATPLFSSPLWITDGVAWQDGGQQRGVGGNGNGNGDGTENGEDPAETNKTFLDTETLCSLSNSFAHARPSCTPVRDRAPVPRTSVTTEDVDVDVDLDARVTSYASDSFISFSTGTGGPLTLDFGDDSFLLSRQTSFATMALTMAESAAVEAASNARRPLLFSQHQRQEPEVELRLPRESAQDSQEGNQHLPKQHHDLGLFNDLDFDHLFPDNFTTPPLSFDRRPSSSRSHLRNQWHRSKSPLPDASKYLRVSSDGPSPELNSLPSMTLTKEEFEALPFTIQRKYFSTLERLRFVSPDSVEELLPRSAGNDQTQTRPSTATKTSKRRRDRKSRVASNSSTSSFQGRPRVTSTDQRFYASLPDKIKRRHLTEEEQLVALYRRQSVILDAADEALLKIGKRQSEAPAIDSPLPSPGLSEGHTSASSMHSRQGTKTSHGLGNKRADSFYDSFRWLEEEDELDLRLYLDDYHINLREEIPIPNKNRRPSFRRHLSINKLPFGRPSLQYNRPGTMDGGATSTFTSPSESPVIGSGQGHVRRKSRALSLISGNKQPMPNPVSTFDPAAAHYQDPEARAKLRVYLASPQKFDEAIEFGFPSLDDMQSHGQKVGKTTESRQDKPVDSKLRTFLADDQSSTYSDVSMADPDSPKTPDNFEKPVPIQPARISTDRTTSSRGVYAHAPTSSREMTLRMTLTRPDLRAHEEQIYGWKQNNTGRAHSRDESSSGPVIYARDGNSKDSIERQLAALDHWNENSNNNTNENGVVKRIWNRVRRS
ncbi:Fc.00g064610.m01.CDS01 [Cosmosporella sp. VM-42]